MYKLVSDIDGTRWSYMNGYYVFGHVVWLTSKEEASKYSLIDKDGNKIDVDSKKFLIKS